MKRKIIELTNTETTYSIDEDQEIVAIFDGFNDTSLKTRITFVHTKPHITSRIYIKAVLRDSSRFDFEGVLKILKGASETDAYLKIDCLLVSDKAYARAIPSLEITENDVKGGHGATIGYIDPEQMYYLKSKGLTTNEAEKLIIEAYLS